MGKSTNIVSNHNLDVSSAKKIAEQLAERFKVNITIYSNHRIYIENKEVKEDWDWFNLETIKYKNATKTYFLDDINYSIRVFIKEHGLATLKGEMLTIDTFLKERILEFQDPIEYDFQDENKDAIAVIHSKYVELWNVDFLHWYSFQQNFIYKLNKTDLTNLNDWRLKCLEAVTEFGGDYMFVFSFEDDSSDITILLEKTKLLNLKEVILNAFKNKFVAIPNEISTHQQATKPEYDENINTAFEIDDYSYALEHNIKLEKVKLTYPSLFFDNFQDLKHKTSSLLFTTLYDNSLILNQIEELKKVNAENNKRIKEHKKRKKVKLPDLSSYFRIFNTFVAGYRYSNPISIHYKIAKNQEVFLVREPDNKYDKYAIALYVLIDNKEREKLGYIAKQENYILSKLLDNKYSLKGYICGLNDTNLKQSDYKYSVRVNIYLEHKN